MDLLEGRPKGISLGKTWLNCLIKDMAKGWLGDECSGSSWQ